MHIQQATMEQAPLAATLACALWPAHSVDAFTTDMQQFIQSEDATIMLAFVEKEAVGFAQCQLRYDYVEGTNSSPVGYLEGVYVAPAFRTQHIARHLIEACEAWAKEKGCAQFASDCDLENTVSYDVHMRLGFTEANRIICFTKPL